MTWLKMTSTYPQRLGHPLSARNEKRAIKKLSQSALGSPLLQTEKELFHGNSFNTTAHMRGSKGALSSLLFLLCYILLIVST